MRSCVGRCVLDLDDCARVLRAVRVAVDPRAGVAEVVRDRLEPLVRSELGVRGNCRIRRAVEEVHPKRAVAVVAGPQNVAAEVLEALAGDVVGRRGDRQFAREGFVDDQLDLSLRKVEVSGSLEASHVGEGGGVGDADGAEGVQGDGERDAHRDRGDDEDDDGAQGADGGAERQDGHVGACLFRLKFLLGKGLVCSLACEWCS